MGRIACMAVPAGGAGAAWAGGGWSCVACTPEVEASTAAVMRTTAATGGSREVSFT
jgi:hypothetical protein